MYHEPALTLILEEITAMERKVTVEQMLKRFGRPAAMQAMRAARYEACCRCGRYFPLARIGKLWCQPQHDCRVVDEA